jgi:hypothetical protein
MMHTHPTGLRPSHDSCAPATRRRALGANAQRPTVDLAPRTVEQIAQRVAQLLRQDPLTALANNNTPRDTSLLTVKELARHLKLNPAWVYEHATELGAIRTGNGPKARMRFDLRTATQALKQHQQHTTSPDTPRLRRPPTRPEPYLSDAPVLRARDPYTRGVRALYARVHRHRIGAA